MEVKRLADEHPQRTHVTTHARADCGTIAVIVVQVAGRGVAKSSAIIALLDMA